MQSGSEGTLSSVHDNYLHILNNNAIDYFLPHVYYCPLCGVSGKMTEIDDERRKRN